VRRMYCKNWRGVSRVGAVGMNDEERTEVNMCHGSKKSSDMIK